MTTDTACRKQVEERIVIFREGLRRLAVAEAALRVREIFPTATTITLQLTTSGALVLDAVHGPHEPLWQVTDTSHHGLALQDIDSALFLATAHGFGLDALRARHVEGRTDLHDLELTDRVCYPPGVLRPNRPHR